LIAKDKILLTEILRHWDKGVRNIRMKRKRQQDEGKGNESK
jgi:hypothetical protein